MGCVSACLCSEREMSHHYCGNCQELTGGGAVEDRGHVAMAPRRPNKSRFSLKSLCTTPLLTCLLKQDVTTVSAAGCWYLCKHEMSKPHLSNSDG